MNIRPSTPSVQSTPGAASSPAVDAVALTSVLQELTRAALDLFNETGDLDDFLQHLATRLGCLAVLWLELSPQGAVRLLGSAGLSRASRELPLTAGPEPPAERSQAVVHWGTVDLPYPELTGASLAVWQFPFHPAAEGSPSSEFLLFFESSRPIFPQYFGLVQRLLRVAEQALEHRGLDARLRESEHRLSEQKLLLECENEATLDGILILSNDGRVVSHNRRLLELWGLTPDALRRGGSARTLLPLAAQHVREPARFLDLVRKLLSTPEGTYTDEFTVRDGRHLELFSAPLLDEDGRLFGRGWYFRDITQRRRAEAERAGLLAREQAARQAAEAARLRSSFLAEASRRLAGHLDAEKALAQAAELAVPFLSDWCVALLVEDDALSVRAAAHSGPAGSERVRTLRGLRVPLDVPEGAPLVARTGRSARMRGGGTAALPLAPLGLREPEHLELLQRLGVCAWLAVPLVARGRTLGVLTLVSTGEAHCWSAEDVELAENLAARVALAVDNARLYEQAQRAIRVRDEFLSVAAHELFTPLTALRLTVQGLQRSAGGVASPGVLGIVDRQTHKLMRLVSELLDTSQLRTGRLSLQLEDVDLGQVVREVAEQLGPELERSGTPLRLDVAPGVVGKWDRLRLEQVVQNLVSNAAKYGERKPVEVRVTADDGWARLVVVDQGLGIPVEDQERIFSPFERAISSRHFGGLGLGLYIVQRIVEQLGGSIRLRSVPGQGSTFVVELPRTSHPASRAPLSGAAPQLH
ncbi:ATP-binding protein [Pyxidicoccus xibeiensis]|uniref:ATP-binding protein n=1 Tax=Pyxidicoccus xibeiensis TaxID=2906759 RepID=UPI0020A755DE|nr:ATP-binding protein [Pyxidicoccus xibeiensis]MCP3136871.1 ATP-binding protein [Pyxidicoccus xibeiensis]